MFEVYYKAPMDQIREEKISQVIVHFDGKISDQEQPLSSSDSQAVCLTCEFEDKEKAIRASEGLRLLGEHVEAVCEYGND